MISLYGFQEAASAQIVSRVSKSLMQPLEISASGVVKRIPFIQLLSSVTASGKTIILAQAVADISIRLPVAPLVLWLSKRP